MQRQALIISAQREYAQGMKELLTRLEGGGLRADVEMDPLRAMQISPHAYELVLLDHPLEAMDGMQLLLLMKSQSPITRFVMVQDHPSEQDRVQAYQDGADVVLARPALPEQWEAVRVELQRLLRPDAQKHNLVRQETKPVRLLDLLQTSCLSGDSILIHAIGALLSGDIFIYRGEIYHAQYPGRSGLTAFREMVHWDGGMVQVQTYKLSHPPVRTIELSFSQLMEKVERVEIDPQSRPATGHLRLVGPPETLSLPEVAKEAPPLTPAEAQEQAENTAAPASAPASLPARNAVTLPPLDSHWKVNLTGELMESANVTDPEQCAVFTHFIYRRLADVAVALDVDYFNTLTLLGPYYQQVLVADNLGIRQAVFETEWVSEAKREQYIKWCYEQSF